MSVQTLAIPPHYKNTIIKQQTVGASNVQITQLTVADILAASPPMTSAPNTVPRPDNIFIAALPANSGTITIMPVNPAASLGAGYILSAGQSLSLPLRDASKYYAFASAAAQVMNIHYQYGLE